MRIQTATHFPKNGALGAFCALADRLWERSALAGKLDEALKTSRVKKIAEKGDLLDPEIYGRPRGDWLSFAIDQLQKAVSDEAPGFAVKSVAFWGKDRGDDFRSSSDCRIGFFGEDANGNPRLFSFREQKPKRTSSGSPEVESFLSWAIQEKIVMRRIADETWEWRTGKSNSAELTVAHPLKTVNSQHDLDGAQSLIFRRASGSAENWRKQRDEKAQELAQAAAEKAARDAVPAQIKRLEALMPADKIAQALEKETAQVERRELSQAIGLAQGEAREKSTPIAKSRRI